MGKALWATSSGPSAPGYKPVVIPSAPGYKPAVPFYCPERRANHKFRTLPGQPQISDTAGPDFGHGRANHKFRTRPALISDTARPSAPGASPAVPNDHDMRTCFNFFCDTENVRFGIPTPRNFQVPNTSVKVRWKRKTWVTKIHGRVFHPG